MTNPRPVMRKRSVHLPESLHDQLLELAIQHDRNLADEIRHALRLYVAINHRDRARRLQEAS